jgi:serine/threonine protein kinase
MPFISGGTLAERLGEYAADPRTAAALVIKVARAIHYAHQHGVLHRDIKPGNILLDDQGEPHVTDFGLARILEDASHVTVTGSVMGSPAYMAPEQAQGDGQAITPATDIYGLGAVLYHLLTGAPPHTGKTSVEVFAKVMDGKIPPPTSYNARLDDNLEAICLKCLAKLPRGRFASASEMAEALEQWLQTAPQTVGPPAFTLRLRRRLRRLPTSARRAGAGIVLMLILLVVGSLLKRRGTVDAETMPPVTVATASSPETARPVYSGWSEPVNLGPAINSGADEIGPSMAADELTLVFASNRPGNVGGARHDLYMARRESRDAAWSPPVNLGSAVNSALMDNGPSLSSDGLSLLFHSFRGGGHGRYDLWQTTRTSSSAPWGAPVNLGPPINADMGEIFPSMTGDGRLLVFQSTRDLRTGQAAFYYSLRESRDAAWTVPKQFPGHVGRAEGDNAPYISADGLTLLFASIREGGRGSYDLWMVQRVSLDSAWSEPVNLGVPVNSSASEDSPSLSPDGLTLLFSSDRPGGFGSRDIWMSTRARIR